MKNTYLIIIVLIIVIGGIFLWKQNGEVEAPGVENTGEAETSSSGNDGAVSSGMPVPGPEGEGVEEMIVSDAPVKEFTVSAQSFSFSPSTITVNKGDRVKITFKNTQGFHDFVIDEYGVAAKQAQSPAEEIIEFTADQAGSFEFYCSVGSHRQMGMKGTLVVQE